MMHRIAFWNIRGLHLETKQGDIRDFIKNKGVQLICLSETKLDLKLTKPAASFISSGWFYEHNLDNASYGRLLTIWNPAFFQLTKLASSDQFLHFKCTYLPSNSCFLLTSVYAQNGVSLRQVFLDFLPSLNSNEPWIVGGDFNCMYSSSHKSGGCPLTVKEIAPLNQALINSCLIPLSSSGFEYTWSNNSRSNPPTRCKLDYIFANIHFVNLWQNSYYEILPPSLSDHCPLLLHWGSVNAINKGFSCFKFFNFWTKHADYSQILLQVWKQHSSRNPLHRLLHKLKALKLNLKVWSSHTFGSGAKLSSTIRHELHRVQEEINKFPNNQNLLKSERELQCKLKTALNMEIQGLKQNAMLRREREADRNTRYFHNSIKIQRLRESIHSINDMHGVSHSDEDGINKAFVDYFSSILAAPPTPINIQPLFNVIIPSLTDEQSHVMVRLIDGEEIKAAAFSLDANSCGGPDGFNAYFIQHSWSIIGDDFTSAIQYFFLNNVLPKSINATAIALIPKINNPRSVSDFRPISCCNILYKIISKILANRLQAVLPSIISLNQSAYIKGRSISDNILLTQELLYGYRRKNISPRCMIKLDIRKAFDSVSWHSILAVLARMNFPLPFIAWIHTCISTPTYSIIRNGRLHGYFEGTTGVRQGDPISAYLFIIVMELLNSLIKEQIQNGNLELHPKCKNPMISHLLFADDLIIFTKPTIKNIQCIFDILAYFHDITGLKINLSKSHILIAGVPTEKKTEIINFSGLAELPTNAFYLGMPLNCSRLTKEHCMPLYEKIINKLLQWPSCKLSQAGRLTIVQSIANAMTTYWSRHYMLPIKLIDMITSALNKFFWHGDPFSKKLIPFAFHKLYDDKKLGGLGITNLCMWNKAAMSTYFERLFSNEKGLWAQWIHSNMIGSKDFWTMSIPQSCSWSWRNILKHRLTFKKFIQCNWRTCTNLSFWHSPWAKPGLILSEVVDYNVMLNSGIPQSALVADYFHDDALELPYSSSPTLRELWHEITNCYRFTGDKALQWMGKEHSIKVVYNLLMSPRQPFPWHSRIWNCGSSAKENLLLWKIMANAVNTKSKLLSYGIISEDMCVLCNSHAETNVHLFFECTFVSNIWSKLLAIGGFHKPSSVSQTEWYNIYKATRWKNTKTCIMLRLLKRFIYEIWLERNNRIFGNERRSSDQIYMQIIRKMTRSSHSTA